MFTLNEENEEKAIKILNDLTALLVNLIEDNVSNFLVLYESDILTLNTEEHYKKQLDKLLKKFE
jgi:hypothetical protein